MSNNIRANISVDFTEATSRQSLNTGEPLPTLLGKIKKFFTDLKSIAFTADYNDLTNKPMPYKIGYATCSTARNEIAKVISCDGFKLETGAIIAICFTDTTSDDPSSGYITLNVNDTGDIRIIPRKDSSFYTSYGGGHFCNHQTWLFLYNGEYFVCLNYDSNTTYGVATATKDGLMSAEDKAKLDSIEV